MKQVMVAMARLLQLIALLCGILCGLEAFARQARACCQAPQDPQAAANQAATNQPPANQPPEKSNEDKRGEGRRGEPRRGGGPPRFIVDAWRREGGALEMLPLLRMSEVRTDLGLVESAFKPKLDAFEAEMWKRMDDTRKKIQQTPEANMAQVFVESLRVEKNNFQKFLENEFTQEQRDRLLGLFIQARHYRAVANELVAKKLNMNESESEALKKDIDSIREDSLNEMRDHIERVFKNGGGRDEIDKLVRENEEKIDWKIKKKLSEAQIQLLKDLQGKPLSCTEERLRHATDLMPRPSRPDGPRPPR